MLTTSVVDLDDSGQLVVGDIARKRQQIHPQMTTSQFKRYMGSAQGTLLRHRPYRAEELSALILRNLKEDAECFPGEPVTEAVVSVPVCLSDAQQGHPYRGRARRAEG